MTPCFSTLSLIGGNMPNAIVITAFMVLHCFLLISLTRKSNHTFEEDYPDEDLLAITFKTFDEDQSTRTCVVDDPALHSKRDSFDKERTLREEVRKYKEENAQLMKAMFQMETEISALKLGMNQISQRYRQAVTMLTTTLKELKKYKMFLGEIETEMAVAKEGITKKQNEIQKAIESQKVKGVVTGAKEADEMCQLVMDDSLVKNKTLTPAAPSNSKLNASQLTTHDHVSSAKTKTSAFLRFFKPSKVQKPQTVSPATKALSEATVLQRGSPVPKPSRFGGMRHMFKRSQHQRSQTGSPVEKDLCEPSVSKEGSPVRPPLAQCANDIPAEGRPRPDADLVNGSTSQDCFVPAGTSSVERVLPGLD